MKLGRSDRPRPCRLLARPRRRGGRPVQGDARALRGRSRYPTAYYGQLARAQLGLGEIALRRPPPEPVHGAARELLRAADILYAIGERDLVASFVTDLAEESSDAAAAALGQLAAHYNHARAMLLIGKAALARDIGVPPYSAIGPQLDRCIVCSIVRTESAFDQRDMSSAKAVGLMQVTPEAGRDTAKRFGVAYDWHRLVSDPVYNTQMGAAEVAALLKEYRGSYIMTFAGYNAGRGRVAQWVAHTAIRAASWKTCRSTARALAPAPRPSGPTCTARGWWGRASSRPWWNPFCSDQAARPERSGMRRYIQDDGSSARICTQSRPAGASEPQFSLERPQPRQACDPRRNQGACCIRPHPPPAAANFRVSATPSLPS